MCFYAKVNPPSISCIVDHVLYLSRDCIREWEKNQDLNTPSDFHIENARNNIVFYVKPVWGNADELLEQHPDAYFSNDTS